jgi:protein-disulfide isomerase
MNNKVIFSVIAVVVLGLVGLAVMKHASAPNVTQEVAAEVGASEWVKGNPDAEVSIIEYADFQCPACAAYHEVPDQYLESFDGKVNLVFRHYPLPFHQHALAAALAAEAAGKQGKFWEMQDLLFETQKEWTNATDGKSVFRGFAEDLGLNMDQYDADLKDKTLRAKVEQDIKTGRALEVPGTPSFFIDGERIDNINNAPAVEAMISAALARAELATVVAEPQEVYADLAIFVNGSAVDLAEQTHSGSGNIVLADETGSVLKKTNTAATLGDFFAESSMNFDGQCLEINGSSYCADLNNSILVSANGELVEAPMVYRFEHGDQLVISFGSTNRQLPAAAEREAAGQQACTFKACE